MSSGHVTSLLDALDRGEPLAAEQLLPVVYEELRRMAGRKMAQEARGHTLQPTALVHEAYLRLVGEEDRQRWQNRGHFYAAAAEAMRRILIESARRRATLKRGGERQRIDLSELIEQEPTTPPELLLSLDEALRRLEQADMFSFQVVMLRHFGGLTVEEAAETLGVSPRTIKRNWAFARAWLQREIDEI